MRNSCLNCKFKSLPPFSDVYVGDIGGKYYPVDKFNVRGASCVFVSSEKGKKALENIKDRIYVTDADAAPAGKAVPYYHITVDGTDYDLDAAATVDDWNKALGRDDLASVTVDGDGNVEFYTEQVDFTTKTTKTQREIDFVSISMLQ